MGLSYREIADRLCISVGTAYNTFQLFQRTGSVEAKQPSQGRIQGGFGGFGRTPLPWLARVLIGFDCGLYGTALPS